MMSSWVHFCREDLGLIRRSPFGGVRESFKVPQEPNCVLVVTGAEQNGNYIGSSMD